MIRRLLQKDNEQVMSYLMPEKELNLLIIGDIQNYGYDKPFQKLWGEFDSDGALLAIMLYYHGNMVFYSRDSFNAKEFIEIMKNEKFEHLSGGTDIIEVFKQHYSFKDTGFKYFCKLDSQSFAPFPSKHPSKTLKDDHLDKIVDDIISLYTSIKEFKDNMSKNIREMLTNTFVDRTGRPFFVQNEAGKIVSMAQTTAENSMSAMVIGVCTHPDYRSLGYSSSCLMALARELLGEGKSLCLFYDNPDAGSIYKKIGFYDIGKWSMFKA